MRQPLDCMLPGRRDVQSKLPLRHIWEITGGVSPEQLHWCRLKWKCADPPQARDLQMDHSERRRSGMTQTGRNWAANKQTTAGAMDPVEPPSAALARRDSNILQVETLLLMDCQTKNQTSLLPEHKLNNQRGRVQAQQNSEGFFRLSVCAQSCKQPSRRVRLASASADWQTNRLHWKGSDTWKTRADPDKDAFSSLAV